MTDLEVRLNRDSRGLMRNRIERAAILLAALALVAAVVTTVVLVTHGPSAGRVGGAHGDPLAQVDADSARATPGSGGSISISWVGDIAMSTQLGLPPGGVQGAMASVRGLLKWADISTGNLEGTLSVGGGAKCGASITSTNCFSFQAPPSYAGGLRAVGFSVMNQANNHSLDFGQTGRDQTVAALHGAGLVETGYPGQITYRTVKGIRVAFLGFAPFAGDASLLDIPTARAMVSNARRHAAVVVVFVHDGAEGATQTHTPPGTEYFLGADRGDVRAFAHAVVQAGASVVLGSGPHVIRSVEDYRGHLIAYSAGNFVGVNTLAGGGVLNDSAIIRVRLSPAGTLLAAQWIPVTLEGGLPHPDPSGASVKLMNEVSAQDFPQDHFAVRPDGQFDLKG